MKIYVFPKKVVKSESVKDVNYLLKEKDLQIAKYVIIAIVAGSATYFLAGLIAYSGIWSIIYKLFICLSVPNLIFLLFFCRSTEFKYVWKRALDFLKKGKGKQEKKVVE